MQDAYCNTTLQKYRHNSEGWGVFFLANVNKKRVMIALLGYIDLIIGLTKNRSLLSSA